MLGQQVFKLVNNKKGMVGINYLHRNGVIAVLCHSPFASQRSRVWLEQEIVRAYQRYYKMVRRESMGEFLHKNTTLINIEQEGLHYD